MLGTRTIYRADPIRT